MNPIRKPESRSSAPRAEAWLQRVASSLPGVSGVVVASAPRAEWVDDLMPSESAWVSDAHPDRRAEYAAGRHLARAALAALGAPDRPLGRREVEDGGPARVPDWPPGFVGSLSHTASHCVVVVASGATIAAIGVDLEAPSRVRPDVLARICTADEFDRWRAEGRDPLQAALHFAAKEAFYKLWQPATGESPGFRDVEVEVVNAARFRLHRVQRVQRLPRRVGTPGAAHPRTARWMERTTFEGSWGADGDLVAAMIGVSAID